MQTMLTDFEDRIFSYHQLSRHGMLAIYVQLHKVSGTLRYEVIRLHVAKAHTWPNGTTTPEHEAYPSSGAWGKAGWTFGTRNAAERKLAALRKHDEDTHSDVPQAL